MGVGLVFRVRFFSVVSLMAQWVALCSNLSSDKFVNETKLNYYILHLTHYIFTIFVAFQGLFIFVVFVLFSKQVRENYGKWWKAKVAESDFLSKHFGDKSFTLGSTGMVKILLCDFRCVLFLVLRLALTDWSKERTFFISG